ncbi:hypothetical protein C8R45DRAFT_633831 [Mycena sanguinolenta]|nr:hypothetical protein C8R45DRAFT_633831 [Mycena sanguinolenta]
MHPSLRSLKPQFHQLLRNLCSPGFLPLLRLSRLLRVMQLILASGTISMGNHSSAVLMGRGSEASPLYQPPSSNLSSGSHAQTSQPSYNFPPAFPANTVPDRLIDPRLRPLPEDNDSDFDPPAVAKLRGLKPATKVASVRQKDKRGKKRARSSDCDDSDDSDVAPAPKHRGRPKGSTNFNGRDVNKLLDLAEALLPLAGNGWKKLTKDHNTWADKHDRPLRDAKSLEAKFKQLVKTRKPTGDPDCSPEVKRAKAIDRKISERVGTRDIGDSEFGGDISSDDSVEVLKSCGKKVHSAVARRAPTPPLPRKSRMNLPELVTKLAKAFDPETQQSMQEERAQRSFQTAQLFSLTQHIRDANATADALRNQLTQMQTRVHEAERARDRAEFKLELHGPAPGGERLSRHGQYIAEQYPDLVRVRGKIRSERIFPEGGGCVEWFTDTSADDDLDKENQDPSSSSGGPSSDFTMSFSSSSADDSGTGAGAGAEAH